MNHLAVLGTSSHVGKSMVVAGLCRVLAREGLAVAPFKAQNMALNAYVALDGGEMGYAQALQAWAAGLEPTVDMNPILMKPGADGQAQLIVQGKVETRRPSRTWLEQQARASFDRLAQTYDVILMEGAGSPVELNLWEGDLANLALPRYAKASLILVGDIDRGGVFASLHGTLALLPAEDRERVQGVLINKFRGNPALFEDGVAIIERLTQTAVLGILPYWAFSLPEEDGVGLESKPSQWTRPGFRVSVAVLPHISNFTDLAALEREPAVSLAWHREPPDQRPDLVVLPGSKATLADLEWLHKSGWAERIIQWQRQGTALLGVCGGFQMLGQWVCDPHHVEGSREKVAGLNLIPAVTTMKPMKITRRRQATVVAREFGHIRVDGYEIHNGDTKIQGVHRPLLAWDDGTKDGYVSEDSQVIGTYLHGILDGELFRRAFLARWGVPGGAGADPVEEGLKQLEEVIREHVGVRTLLSLVGV